MVWPHHLSTVLRTVSSGRGQGWLASASPKCRDAAREALGVRALPSVGSADAAPPKRGGGCAVPSGIRTSKVELF